VLVPLHAHVAVDGIQALGDRAAALDVRFLGADDLQIAAPIAGFIRGPAAAHPAADDENVRIDMNGLSATHQTNHRLDLLAATVGNAAILSASGSCASCCDFIASALGAA